MTARHLITSGMLNVNKNLVKILRDGVAKLMTLVDEASFDHGVEVHDIDGVPVHITTAAKTVADCFKFRSSVGLDVAMAALRDYVRKRAGTLDELWEAARACRVHNVMRPYLEMEMVS